jgi:hypothetical protein
MKGEAICYEMQDFYLLKQFESFELLRTIDAFEVKKIYTSI